MDVNGGNKIHNRMSSTTAVVVAALLLALGFQIYLNQVTDLADAAIPQQLVYSLSSRDDSDTGLTLVNEDGTGSTDLNLHNKPPMGCSFNRDGTKMFFEDSQGGSYTINRATLSGDSVQSVTEIAKGFNPMVSPDGKQLAYFRDGDLYVAGISAGTKLQSERPIWHASTGQNALQASWSNQNKIAFSVGINNGSSALGGSILSINSNGTGLHAIVPFSDSFWGSLSWSPDGRHLAATRNDPIDGIELENIDSATGAYSPITYTGVPPQPFTQYAYQPKWSPDGSNIAFINHATFIPGSSVFFQNVYTVNLGTHVASLVTHNSTTDASMMRLCWRPRLTVSQRLRSARTKARRRVQTVLRNKNYKVHSRPERKRY